MAATQDTLPSAIPLIVYCYSGCFSGGFSVQLNDGLNSIKKEQFDVKIRHLEVKETVNKELSVFPGMESLITKDHLLVETTDRVTNQYCC